ncbi:glycosyltransferase family 4 protein [Halogranum rubrum]|uniref:Glycosyltransferase subfamily 4-like N-terminal domain-containing protein n=1 Tax=Halogranum salarium B-1 TaxID=1210908 RepID=J3JD05_9EURY|nr:glycosyltransferase family 4 protein [Halogranum salarium]EJN57069.1 hypothetical protein HSB1_44550 [Halogranum salarium B-1]
MHVLYLVGQSTGGLPHYTAELANAMTNYADVTVMKPAETTGDDLFDDDVQLIDAFDPIGVSMPQLYSFDVNPLDFVKGFLSYNNVKQIKQLDPDIVHDTTDLFPQVKLFAKLHRIDKFCPFIVTRHEVSKSRFSISRPPVFVEELMDLAIPDLDLARVVVHTKKQKRAMLSRGVTADHIDIIPHGAYTVFGSKDDVDTAPEKNTLLFFGNIVTPKGLDTLVKAIPLVKRDVPDVKLLIAGEGRIPNRVQSIVEAHEENFEVHNYFVPNQQVRELFARTEVVALPYRSQGGTKGHSGALATAFSFGKPVVASTAGEFTSLVADSGCGLVVPPEDPTQLAAAITQILRDDDGKREMAANSSRMADELSWDNIAQQYLAVYERALRKKATPQMETTTWTR